MNKGFIAVGTVAIAVIIFLGYMVFNQQQQIDVLIDSVEKNQLQAEIDKQELKDQSNSSGESVDTPIIEESPKQGYEQLTQRIKEIKITESKSIYDLENEYDTSNRLIELGWNKPTEQSPEFTITDDLNIEALNSVKEGVIIAVSYTHLTLPTKRIV